MSATFCFIIDTDHFAGDFDRQLCGYLTGVVGDCGIGTKAAELFRADTIKYAVDYDKYLGSFIEPDTIMRPVTITPTPGRFNNGLGGHFETGEEEKALKDYKSRCQQLIDLPDMCRESTRLHTYLADWADELESNDLKKWPAYESVAILFRKKPTSDMIRQKSTRTHRFI